MYMYHSVLIHSSADGHLGCCYILAIVNGAAVNTGAHMSFSISFPWGICPVVVLLVRMVVLFLVF